MRDEETDHQLSLGCIQAWLPTGYDNVKLLLRRLGVDPNFNVGGDVPSTSPLS